MTTLERPPVAVFCLACGPQAVLERDPAAPLLRCASCDAVTEVPAPPLFVVTGASGTGKTTVTVPLRRLLPECEVFEGDPISQIAALGWDVFGDTWLRIAHEVALNGRPTVLCTSMMPDRLENLPARKLLGPVYFGNLDCPDDILAARLRARPAWRHASTEEAIANHQRFAAWLRAHIDPTWDTSTLTPGEAAEHIAAWARSLLLARGPAPAGAQPPHGGSLATPQCGQRSTILDTRSARAHSGVAGSPGLGSSRVLPRRRRAHR